MIVVVPIPLGPPAMAIFIPPAVIRPPAPLALFAQFVTRIVGLRALVSIVFDGFVQPVVGPRNPALTIVVRLRPWNRGNHQKTGQRHRR